MHNTTVIDDNLRSRRRVVVVVVEHCYASAPVRLSICMQRTVDLDARDLSRLEQLVVSNSNSADTGLIDAASVHRTHVTAYRRRSRRRRWSVGR